MVGYSRLIGLDAVGPLERLRALRRGWIDLAISEYGGRIVPEQAATPCSSCLIASMDAVRCAVKVQQQIPAHDRDQPADRC